MAVPLRGAEDSCGFPGSPAYGSVAPERAAYASGDAVAFSCRVGYILLGAAASRCGPDGFWSEQVPICDDSMTTLGVAFSTPTVAGHSAELAIDRSKETCAYLKPKKPRWWRIDIGEEQKILSVAVTMMSPDKYVKFTVFVIKTQGTSASYKRCASFSGKFGTQTVVLSCAEGKGIEGHKVHIEDHQQTEGLFEICEVEVQVEKDTGYDCGKPSRSLHSITYEPDRDEVKYGCIRGYELIGRDERTCEKTGQWSGNPPLCHPILCDDLPPLDNGHFRVTHDLDGPPLEGALVVYQCDEGFRLEGTFLRVCLRDGAWSGTIPQCKAIRCPVPDGKELGGVYRLVNKTNSMGSMALLRCKGGQIEGNNPYITCTDDGTWTKAEAHCLFPARVSFEKREEARIENKGAIIFGMVVAAIMIVVVLVGIYLYGQRRNGVKPELPDRCVKPVPPPRPPPRNAFRTAIMGCMSSDSEDDPRKSSEDALVEVLPAAARDSPIPENEDSPIPEKEDSPIPEKEGSPIPEKEGGNRVPESPSGTQEEDESEAEKKTASASSESEDE